MWGRAWASRLLWLHMNRLSFTLKWWAESLAFMHDPYLKRSQLGVHNLYGQRAACCWWLVRSCCDKQEVRCRVCLKLSRLCYGCQRCTLAVAQHCPSPIEATYYSSIFGKYLNAHLKFTVYGRKQASMYVTKTLPQCSPASVGLAQARPNYVVNHSQ